MIHYVLNDEGITFFVDGIIVLDCPIARLKSEPVCAVQAMKLLEEFWQRKVEILTLKGGDMKNG